MAIDGIGAALSGIDAAHTRVRNSAHNVANLTTEEFHNLRTRQVEQPGGGVRAETVRDAEPRPVDLARERVDQILARVQAQASQRALETQLELTGSLVDLEA
jgi:flagellar hook protein FlgE